MSGGVDSLRTAALLKEKGHDVFALHMRLLPTVHLPESRNDDPSWMKSEAALTHLASRLGIPLVITDFRTEFHREVITPFLNDYRQGLTPNPCIICNAKVKFGLLWNEARKHGAQRLATGHYVRTLPGHGPNHRIQLLRGMDRTKDQSYFLALLPQSRLAVALFPLGHEYKQDVRAWARQQELDGHTSNESQEICFIPKGNYREFLQAQSDPKQEPTPGLIVDMDGTPLGEHRGIFAYTIGQRRGLGIPSHAPYYVVALDPLANTVRVGREQDLFRSRLTVSRINWVSMDPPAQPLGAQVRIRYKHQAAPARVVPLGEDRAEVCFQSPQRAITPGQAAVFYDGERVLGGGFIDPEAESTPSLSKGADESTHCNELSA